MDTEPIRIVVDGQNFSVQTRPGTSGGTDAGRLDCPVDTGSPLPVTRAGTDEAMRAFLAGINPATGFLDGAGERSSARVPVPCHTTYAKPLTTRKA